MAKLYYSTYICQLWSGDSNQISEKAIKGLNVIKIKINVIGCSLSFATDSRHEKERKGNFYVCKIIGSNCHYDVVLSGPAPQKLTYATEIHLPGNFGMGPNEKIPKISGDSNQEADFRLEQLPIGFTKVNHCMYMAVFHPCYFLISSQLLEYFNCILPSTTHNLTMLKKYNKAHCHGRDVCQHFSEQDEESRNFIECTTDVGNGCMYVSPWI